MARRFAFALSALFFVVPTAARADGGPGQVPLRDATAPTGQAPATSGLVPTRTPARRALTRALTWLATAQKETGDGSFPRGEGKDLEYAPVAITALGARQGVVDAQEVDLVRNLLGAMRSQRVRDIMTPKPVVFGLPADATVGEVHEEVAERPFSRIVLWEAGEERLAGYVLKDDVLEEAAADRFDVPLRTLRHELPLVPDSLPVARLLRRFLAQRAPLAAVVDEYGAIAGIVTMEDAIEELFGQEIVDEADEQGDLRGEAERRWRQRRARMGAVAVGRPSGAPGEAARAGDGPRGAEPGDGATPGPAVDGTPKDEQPAREAPG